MQIDDELRDELDERLSNKDLERFEEGELAIMTTEPKYAFHQVVEHGYQRADVVFEHSPSENPTHVGRFVYDIHESTAADVLHRVAESDSINAVPAVVGFGKFAKGEENGGQDSEETH